MNGHWLAGRCWGGGLEGAAVVVAAQYRPGCGKPSETARRSFRGPCRVCPE
jgi:hypothetical protein